MKIYLIREKIQNKFYAHYGHWKDFHEENLLTISSYYASTTGGSKSVWGYTKRLCEHFTCELASFYDRAYVRKIDYMTQELIQNIESKTGERIENLIAKYVDPTNLGVPVGSYYYNLNGLRTLYSIIMCCMLDLLEITELDLSFVPSWHWHIQGTPKNIEDYMAKSMRKTYSKYNLLKTQRPISVEDL